MKKRRRETESASRVFIMLSMLCAVFSMLSSTPATAQTAPRGPNGGGPPPLSDFFQLTTPRQFVPVSINNNPWPYTCFQNWNCNGVGPYVPGDPDEY